METLKINMPVMDEILSKLVKISSKLDEIQNQKPSKKWLTNKEASKLLQVTARTMQNYRDKGIIPFSQVGSKIYYKQSDLDAHLESHFHVAYNRGRRIGYVTG